MIIASNAARNRPPAPEQPWYQTTKATDAPGASEVAQPQSSPPDVQRPEPAWRKRITLRDIIRAARTWRPIFADRYGQSAADFVVRDIEGKEHKLSNYRGKNVLIVFWATWCQPCHAEIPHLIELRNQLGDDELAILAISNEAPALLSRFAAKAKMNYTVISADTWRLPLPFSRIRAIPATFFIDPEGKIKLAAEGVLSLAETKAILQAGWDQSP